MRWPGQWKGAESGLHCSLNRYYDPETGQYLSRDPISVDGSLRAHAHVYDPLRWFDPLGLAACTRFQYNQVYNPGPLAQLQGNPASSFAGGRYNATTLADDLVLYCGGEVRKPLGNGSLEAHHNQ